MIRLPRRVGAPGQRTNQIGNRGVDLLLCDSTNAERPGFTGSERLVGEAFRQIIPQREGRVLVASFASNVHRMQQAIDVAVRADGKEARTRYQVEETWSDPGPVARVECRLETGRTHQIRVHMKAIGHPIVGDDRYGGGRTPVRSPRPFLHAAELGLTHPVTGETMRWSSPLPADLAEVLATLRR